MERFAPGLLVAGRYRIVAFLGRGGMGEVYRAHDVRLDEPVALKFLPARLESRPEALERFVAEVRLGRQVSHPNVCRLYDLGEHEGHLFISMEYVDGEDLASLLRRNGRLPSDQAMRIARDVAAGLAAAHAIGIVHRDLKPSNVIIDRKGRSRVSDFGLAVASDEEAHAQMVADLPAYWKGRTDGRALGTPAYMAPEQLAGKETTPQSDVYAFGLIVRECLPEDVDPAVERLLRRCVEVDPLRRPASGQSLVDALSGRGDRSGCAAAYLAFIRRSA